MDITAAVTRQHGLGRALGAALALALVTACAVGSSAQAPASAANAAPAFTLAPLPYPADALEPVIDAQTMTIHHGRHHQAYVDNLNRAVAADPALQGLSLADMMARMSSLPVAVRNNGGGHWNHDFFWASMAPVGSGGAPSPALAAAIARDFGSQAAMQQRFDAAGTGQFGSGWAWLIVTPGGKLAITATPNQDNPLMDLSPVRGVPILGNDVWEHAYYLKYQNRRAAYMQAWWQVVDWNIVSARFEAATKP